MDELFQIIWKGAAASGLPLLMLIYAIRWLQGNNRELITELNNERKERLNLLEEHVSECDRDRTDLRQQIINLMQSGQIQAAEQAAAQLRAINSKSP